MPKPSVAEFWELLVRSRLLDAAAAASARADFAAAAPSDVDTRTAAAWLVRKGLLTRWQAKRLAAGNLGPFFLGDYRLLERHDRPGDALVFTARHEPSARIVALVMLSASRCQAVDVWTEIVRRTTAAYQTGEPMLSRTWALEQSQGARFIVAEQVTGETLAQELARLGPMPAPQVGVLGVQLATAVAAIHAQGVLHGGVSLETLVREPNPATPTPRTGRVRLLQFPQATDPHLVPLRARVATPDEIASLAENACFVAPELVMPDTTCDERSDVYTIGCVLYALVSGAPPCWCGSPGATLQRAAFVGPEPLRPPVPAEVVTLVGRLMARDPAARIPTAAEAAAAIAACFGMAAPTPVVATSKPLPSALVTTVAAAPPPPVAATAAVADGLPRIDVQAAPRSAAVAAKAAGRGRRGGRGPLIGGLAAVAAIAAAVVAFILTRPAADENEPAAEEVATAPATAETPAAVEPADVGADAEAAAPPGRFVVVEDDQTLPWAPPTAGQPPSLAYLAPGSQLMLLLRPAAALAGEEGRRIVTALGPQTQAAIDRVATLCGCDLVDMESITAGWQSGAAGDPVVAFAVRFVPPRTGPGGPAERKVAWGDTTAEEVGPETVHRQAGDGLGFWLPRAERGGVLVVGPPDLLLGMAREAGAGSQADTGPLVAQLPQDLETLVAMLDGERHATLLASTGYLLGGAGRALLSGSLDKLAGPLGDFCGDDVSALAVSVQAGDNFYAELDAVGRADAKPPAVAARLAAAVEALPGTIEEYCSALEVAPYGRKIVLRLPSMVRALAATLRLGAEGKGVVLNAYLPPTAGHNLALAAELALAQEPGAVAVAAAPRAKPPASGAIAKLQTKMTLVFAKDTLEKSIQMIADEVGVPMEIVGTDLQLEGITKNQSFALDERDATAEAILRTILAKANPDGKLVFVIRSKDGTESIDITTRSAAEKRGDVLPPGF